MEQTAQILLFLHIATGFTALVTGLLAIVSRKGGVLHKRSGSIFFWCMVTVALTAVVLSAMRGHAFLLHIGLFALYQAHGGWRSIRNKALRPAAQDWLLLAIGGLNGGWMVATLNPVLLVFGGISVWLAIQDTRTFIRTARRGTVGPKAWLVRHIGMMLGTYIATFTAFLLTAMGRNDLGGMAWLAPTIIGVPFIVYATRRFTGKAKVART
jgi:uncharacterized membrane protein